MSSHQDERGITVIMYSDRDWHQIIVGTVMAALAVAAAVYMRSPIATVCAMTSLAAGFFSANVADRYHPWAFATCAVCLAVAWIVIVSLMIWA